MAGLLRPEGSACHAPAVTDPTDALFERDGELFVPTEYAQGPWDPNAQFGGSPAALLSTLIERVPTLTPMGIARFTIDLLRPVPMDPLTADVRVVREGKRIQVVAASLFAHGTEVARATALRIRRIDLGTQALPDGRRETPMPTTPKPTNVETYAAPQPHGSRRAVEYLFEEVGGYFYDPAWVRLRVGVLKGEAVSPIALVTYTADMGSGMGVSMELPVRGINADVTVNVLRYPETQWLRLTGTGWISGEGIGQSHGEIHDTSGLVALVSLARVVDPEEP